MNDGSHQLAAYLANVGSMLAVFHTPVGSTSSLIVLFGGVSMHFLALNTSVRPCLRTRNITVGVMLQ